MKGFFSEKQTKSIHSHKGKILSCISCGLFKDVESPKMTPTGEFQKGIMLIGEAPSQLDDDKASHFNDSAGRFLKHELRALGVDVRRDCISINAINCHPGKREPNAHEINCCRRIVDRAISKYKPKLIILLGKAAITSLIGHRWANGISSVDMWRGWTIPDQDYKCWLCPTLDPGYVEGKDKEVQLIFRQDLKRALEVLEKPFPLVMPYQIHIIEDLRILSKIKSEMVAIDYETTGMKPHAPGHRIVCASVSPDPDTSYVFMMPASPKERKPYTDLLKNPHIGKTAQNMKFEDAWSFFRLRTEVVNWKFDTQPANHIIDNRDGTTGLKFQTYVNFGVVDYNSEVSSYLRAPGNGGNELNRIMELVASESGRIELMNYCGQDTIYEYRLAELNMKKLDYHYLPF